LYILLHNLLYTLWKNLCNNKNPIILDQVT
jgi:hypothetical protein